MFAADFEKLGYMSRKRQEIILENITVENIAAEGKALAHVDGAVLFLPSAVPSASDSHRRSAGSNTHQDTIYTIYPFGYICISK